MTTTKRGKKNKDGVRKSAGIRPSPQITNPALEPIKQLVGDWEMELSNTSFLPKPSDTAHGPASFEWVQDGAYLELRMGDGTTPSAATWMIGRDEAFPDYKVLYYDARHVSRIYEMSFSGNDWKMWRGAPGFWQRFEGKMSEDGNTILAHWDKSSDGTNWEHDFDQTYTRVN